MTQKPLSLSRLRCTIITIMSKIATPKSTNTRTELEQSILAVFSSLGRSELTRADLMGVESVRLMTWASVHAALKNLVKARVIVEVKSGWRLA